VNTIVVGVGEQRASAAAVQWAATEAARRGWELELLRALQYPNAAAAGVGAWYPDDLLGELDALAAGELQDAHDTVSAAFPALVVRSNLVHTHPRLALTQASGSARMVVTGSRRRSALAGALLGSTSLHVAAHSRCPVAVVHDPPAPQAAGVVVGYDGSAAADQAVAFAAEEAEAAGEELLVVHSWFLAEVFPGGFDPGRYVTRSQHQEDVQRYRLERVAAGVQDQRPGLSVRSRLLVDEFASEGLVTAAAGARLLVVGTRGHGAFASMLLGSTSRNVLQNATTPVVVVPDQVRVAGSSPLELSVEEPSPVARPVADAVP
jgi:nucleotide-binding universal stress UspA family protein